MQLLHVRASIDDGNHMPMFGMYSYGIALYLLELRTIGQKKYRYIARYPASACEWFPLCPPKLDRPTSSATS